MNEKIKLVLNETKEYEYNLLMNESILFNKCDQSCLFGELEIQQNSLFSFKNCLYPWAVTAKPSGTIIPLFESDEYISPSEAFLPPTLEMSLMFISEKCFITCILLC